jgi:exodeoxyribonuclease VII large subunit
MHNAYGFSMQVQNIELVGEGSLRRAAELLQIKLTKEGIFDMDKKRPLPYPPTNIGLITSAQSAAYHDFVKIINNRWRGLNVNLIDVQVQGGIAESQIIRALNYFNDNPDNIEAIVLIRGGGSAEDLATFNSEAVTRAVAASKIPTLVAIGHEIDVSLAELAADRRASTPSHAAEIIVPDKRVILNNLKNHKSFLDRRIHESIDQQAEGLRIHLDLLNNLAATKVTSFVSQLNHQKELLKAYNPKLILERGYAVIRKQSSVVRSINQLSLGDVLDINLAKGGVSAVVKSINKG